MSKVISVINWKGGVGKTTLTYHIGIKLQDFATNDKKYPDTDGFPRTLLIDLDPQCNLSIACMSEDKFEDSVFRSKPPIKTVKNLFELYLDNKIESADLDEFILAGAVRANPPNRIYKYVDLLPSHPDLIYTDMEIATFSKRNFKQNLISSEIYKFQIVNTFVNKLRERYDFIFIDCPPNLNYITQNALYESDFYLIPTILDKLSSYGILSIKNKVDELNKMFTSSVGNGYNHTQLAGIVANNVREYGGIPKDTQYNILSSLRNTFKKKVFENYLTNGDGIPKASEQGYPVYALDGKTKNATKQSAMLEAITKELLLKVR
jgi:chromosome partitioning protein